MKPVAMVIETRPQPVELADYPAYPPVALKLWQAREYLAVDESRWIKNKLHDGHGGYCAVGISQKTDESLAGLHYLHAALPVDSLWIVPEYNNASSRTHADILALFDRAINLALQEGK